ncbi:hypothetical protein IV203_000138 [Nitzschia inconspicua]|uniref:Uncharacterized protein n=1 Tax=Nitzschia inconspicua TaxID=303405 RepID=A0A9K3PQ15_9STRA|nr:hypothetical protein IV203_000138 [Nitzschia inconspicua]
MSTPASFVWVQLYYNEKEEPEGRVFKIKPVPDDVDALAKEVKEERRNTLSHCDAADLSAFSPGTKPPFAQRNSLKPGKKLEELIEELKDETPPTSDDHPLVVVAPPPQQQLAPPAKKRKLAYQFGKKFGCFAKYVDDSINNIEETVIFERDDVEQEILNWLEPIKASPKPNCVTIWSGRGSGKTSLIRKITTSSDYFQAVRDCGRLMIIDAKRDNVGQIPEELNSNPEETVRFLVTLVGYHLCRVFEDTSIDGVDFTSAATVKDLWNNSKTLPFSLVEKLDSIRSGKQAYDWWKSCTKGFLTSEEGDGPNPIIVIDTAEVLAVVNDLHTPMNSPSRNNPASRINDSAAELHDPASGIKDSAAELHVSTRDSENMPIPSPRKHQSSATRYLVLEWLMMGIPNDHTIVAFGTGQTRELPAPADFQTHVNHKRLAPLNALSEEAATRLYCRYTHNLREGQVVTNPLNDLEDKQIRYVRTVYAVTAGIPRMLVQAFSSKKHSLTASRHENWENHVLELYKDASELVREGKLNVKCLAKAILISAVCDVGLKEGVTIPGEEVTWDNLCWWSIAFLAGRDCAKKTGHYYRIPRLLWHREAGKIHQWVESECKFNVHDLLPTIQHLYRFAGDAAATSSGTAWKKMFASALVARFFSLCWMKGLDPKNSYIGLDELLPQIEENSADIKTLERVEVCLVNGISANAEKEVFASKATLEEQEFDPKAIHANWEHSSAHHDLVLPVRLKKGDSKHHMLYAVSARNGHHKTEAELLQTKQHLVNKTGSKEKVEGLIQALNPRWNQSGRKLKKEIKDLTKNEKYAEVVITEGHVHYVLGCFF